jgi:hypothetical protein
MEHLRADCEGDGNGVVVEKVSNVHLHFLDTQCALQHLASPSHTSLILASYVRSLFPFSPNADLEYLRHFAFSDSSLSTPHRCDC